MSRVEQLPQETFGSKEHAARFGQTPLREMPASRPAEQWERSRRRFPTLLRLALGGGIWGSVLGSIVGAAIGGAYGLLHEDVSMGLEGAILGNVFGACAGAVYGLVLGLRNPPSEQ